jgi:hypothetical protein
MGGSTSPLDRTSQWSSPSIKSAEFLVLVMLLGQLVEPVRWVWRWLEELAAL